MEKYLVLRLSLYRFVFIYLKAKPTLTSYCITSLIYPLLLKPFLQIMSFFQDWKRIELKRLIEECGSKVCSQDEIKTGTNLVLAVKISRTFKVRLQCHVKPHSLDPSKNSLTCLNTPKRSYMQLISLNFVSVNRCFKMWI